MYRNSIHFGGIAKHPLIMAFCVCINLGNWLRLLLLTHLMLDIGQKRANVSHLNYIQGLCVDNSVAD